MPAPPVLFVAAGQRFTRLTVSGPEIHVGPTRRNPAGGRAVPCACDCGSELVVLIRHLLSGNTKSCGCLRRDRAAEKTLFIAVGQRFGRWTVTGQEIRVQQTERNPYGRRAVPVKCSCQRGTEKIVTFGDLLSGKSQGCGCLRNERASRRNREANPAITHGMTKHPLFDTWRKILSRCENPADKDWPNYGGRGITVCDAWHDVTAFAAWIDENLGPRPAGMTLDREDNNGNYVPGNMRWATILQQNRNKRTVRQRW
jgi:hypothetical protein